MNRCFKLGHFNLHFELGRRYSCSPEKRIGLQRKSFQQMNWENCDIEVVDSGFGDPIIL